MNKILIIGIVASGKTTLAKKLAGDLHIPWYELDAIVHQQTAARRYKRTPAEQMEVIQAIDQIGEWIMEGTDRDSYQCLYEMADTIIFLDTPLLKRRIRIFTRFLKQKLGLEKCHYKPDYSMLKMMYRWTQDFERNRDRFEAKLQRFEPKVVRLTDSNDLDIIQNRRSFS
ncbi:P-loop NTPase family protein [Paenibacillus kobensis]|uniref:EutP/PduV family microcompartment system protein n=1 Tax=Paenibacillus kobensis TaxID=59841 RepID=UPI000FD8DE5A|nr:EutP/PduV family microcompartment system protein [Paenibacillus kobensis]